jgi:NNP family nitrate/nitrite transporter-like MFS transporter
MVATPVLAGALLRIVMGILVDHLKPKMAAHHRPGHRHRALFVAWQVRRPFSYEQC